MSNMIENEWMNDEGMNENELIWLRMTTRKMYLQDLLAHKNCNCYKQIKITNKRHLVLL